MRNKLFNSFIVLILTIVFFDIMVYAEDISSDDYNNYVYPMSMYRSDGIKGYSMKEAGVLENISAVSGNLEIKQTDIFLKGRNGLDLSITRCYNSSVSSYSRPFAYSESARYDLLFKCFEVIGTETITTYENGKKISDDEIEVKQTFDRSQEAYATKDAYNNGQKNYYYTHYDNGVQRITYYEYSGFEMYAQYFQQVVQVPNLYDGIDPLTFEEKYFNLGTGWSFDFPMMEIAGSYKYLHFGSNGMYEVKKDATGSYYLDDYPLKDLIINTDSGAYGNGQMSSSYVLIEKDGKKSYFGSDGRLLGVVDRYGNEIKFNHIINSNGNKPIISKIIDSVGREITIDYTSTQVIIKVIDNTDTQNSRTIYYNRSSNSSGTGNLMSVVDAENQETKYEYTYRETKFVFRDKDPYFANKTTPFLCLSKITYPSGGETRYSYTEDVRFSTKNLGMRGGHQFCKVIDRADYKKDGTRYNYKKYNYGNYYNGDKDHEGNIIYEYDGYPVTYPDKISDMSITYAVKTQIKDNSNNTEDYTFKYVKKTPLCTETILEGTEHKTELLKEYDLARKLPSKSIKRLYNKASGGYTEAVESYEYNDFGELVGSWDSQTQRTAAPGYAPLDEEHKVTSSYHPTYHYLTGKTYKKDANTTIREEYTPTGDGKSIEWAKVFENEGLKNLSWFGYDSYGNVSASRSYLDNWTDYTQTNYSYTDNDSNRNGKFNGLYITRKWVDGIKDADGNLIEAKGGNPSGTIDENYKYDWFGNVLEKQDGTGNTLSYTYDKLGRVLKETNPDGTFKTFGYTINLTENSVQTTDENGVQLKYIYDEFGNLLYARDVQTGENLSSSTYDEKMRLKTDSNINSSSDGCIITYQYYTDNRAKQKEVKDKSGRLVAQENYSYDNADSNGQYLKITRVIKGDTNSPDITTTTYVNKHGQLEKQGRLNQGTEYIDTFKYDYLGNKVEEKTARANNENWGEAFTTQYAYNHAGKAVRVNTIEGRSTTTEYDALGRVKAVTDYKGNRTNYTYDSLGRLLIEEIPFESNGKSIKKTYYNRNGNVSSQQVTNSKPGEALNYNQMKYDYDSRNRLTKVTTYDSGTPENYTQYYYDNAGNKLRMYTGLSAPITISGLDAVQPNGDSEYSTTKYAYDRFNRLIEKVDPLGKTESYTYDLNGTNIRQTDRNGSIITASMDGLKRTISKSVVTADHTGDTTYSYGYTLTGNRLSMNGGGINTTYAYDSLGRLALESSTDGITKEYTYDAGNNRKTFKIKQNGAEKESTSYNYDKMDRLSKVYENGQLIATYAYDANGNRDTLTYGNGVWTKYEYNLNNKLKSLSNKNAAGTELSKFDYTYYLDGNQSSKSDKAGITNYKYDGLGRINTVEGPNGLFKQYGYDDRNNRSDLTGTGEIFTYAEDMTFQYDGFNQLKSAVGIHNVSFTYNGDGLRRTKTVDGVTTTQVLDGGNVDLEIKGTEVTKYVRGVNLIAMEKNGQRYYYLYNGHGDVVQVVDNAGNVVNNYEYDEWGNIVSQTEGIENSFKYCGEYLDKETGLYYLRARYYDPTIGRFISEDGYWKDKDGIFEEELPVLSTNGEGINAGNMFKSRYNEKADTIKTPSSSVIIQSSNLYVYCMNNPIMYIDPSGNVTFGVGGDVAAAFLLRVGLSGQLVADLNGNVGILVSASGGGGTPALGGSLSGTITNADKIKELKDLGFNAGGSICLFPGIPGVGVQYTGNSDDIHGVNISVDWDAKPWAEGHAEASWSFVIPLWGKLADEARAIIKTEVEVMVNKLSEEAKAEIMNKLGVDSLIPEF